jgi:triosephosphate isomerase
MRTPLLVANWKMHKTVQEAVGYVREFSARMRDLEGVELVVAPPFTALAAAAEIALNTNVAVAAQDVAAEREGAFTGEVSAAMIADTGATFAIIGHSERRRLYGETDALVHAKRLQAQSAGLTPIVCIGETLVEREAGRTHEILDRQLAGAFAGATPDEIATLVIAYEPVWAIGTGRNATEQEAGDAHRHIRRRLAESFGESAAEQCRVIYGGSVKPDNVAALTALPDVDGALVGGASLNVAVFCDIAAKTR